MGQLGQWILRLAGHKFHIVHTEDVENIDADALSRMFDNMASGKSQVGYIAEMQDLPLFVLI
jgi:hypothetical protein